MTGDKSCYYMYFPQTKWWHDCVKTETVKSLGKLSRFLNSVFVLVVYDP